MRKKLINIIFYERVYYRLESRNLHEMSRENEIFEIKFSIFPQIALG